MYVAAANLPPDTIRRSLQALLSTRHRPIPRHRFTVLDTFDGRVRRAGAFLTRDAENGPSRVTWQSQTGGSALEAELEAEANFAWDFPDGPLQQRVASVIGPRRLIAQADAEEYGSVLDVLDERGKTVARLRIASGLAKLPAATAAWQPLPTTITLTSLHGYEEAYTRLVPVIESRPGVEPCPEGPCGMVLGRVGAVIRGDSSLPRVDLPATISADVGARRIHMALLGLLDINEPGVRADLDTEFLHDFRVAVRRTRALLGQIRRVFPQDAVDHFRIEFSWLGRLTGPLRDLDVLALALRRQAGELSGDDRDALMAAIGTRQRQEHARLVQALDSGRFGTLRSSWQSFLERPVAQEHQAPDAVAALHEVVSRRAWRLCRRIANSGASIDDYTSAEQIHAVRIAAKKLRYLIDVTPTFYDPADVACVLSALKKLQRVLGDFNDADVQERRLIECGHSLAAGAPPSVLMTLGRLAERCKRRREELRRDVRDSFEMFCAREARTACRRAFQER